MACREGVAVLFARARDAQLVALLDGCAQNGVLPVGAATQSSNLFVGVAALVAEIIFLKLRPFRCVEQFEPFADAACADIVGVIDVRCLVASLSLFGCHQNDAVCAARAVDGRCRHVFQHLNALNVVRVDGCQRVQAALDAAHARASLRRVFEIDEAVNHIQRLVRSVHRVAAADADLAVGARLTATCRHVQASNLSAQSAVERCRLRLSDDFGLDRGHAARQLRAFLRAVAHHNHLAQLVQIFSQLNFNRFRCLVNVDFLRAVAHKRNRERERKLHFGFECEISVKVGHRAQLVACCGHHGCADERVACSGVGHTASNCGLRRYPNC